VIGVSGLFGGVPEDRNVDAAIGAPGCKVGRKKSEAGAPRRFPRLHPRWRALLQIGDDGIGHLLIERGNVHGTSPPQTPDFLDFLVGEEPFTAGVLGRGLHPLHRGAAEIQPARGPDVKAFPRREGVELLRGCLDAINEAVDLVGGLVERGKLFEQALNLPDRSWPQRSAMRGVIRFKGLWQRRGLRPVWGSCASDMCLWAALRASCKLRMGYRPSLMRRLALRTIKVFAPPWETLHPKAASFVSQ
jgi:hypothetical protein